MRMLVISLVVVSTLIFAINSFVRVEPLYPTIFQVNVNIVSAKFAELPATSGELSTDLDPKKVSEYTLELTEAVEMLSALALNGYTTSYTFSSWVWMSSATS